ncbi:ribosome-binding factor A [Candidatus Parcubacteria bacterium]|nr:ribosome-binding factor A [Candidatus Parcubacteria bacterium]
MKREIIAEILHRLSSKFVLEEGSQASLLTITRAELSPSGKEARIYFTTLPEKEEDTALKFLERKTAEFQRYVRDESRIGIVPHITFMIDYGERNRQRLDELSS